MDFATLFALGEKDAVIHDMISTLRGLFSAGAAREKYAAQWRVTGRKFSALLLSQNPSTQSAADSLTSLIDRLADAELALSAAEIRAADDFRDVIERYDVLFRVNEEYLQAKNQFTSATTSLERAVAIESAEKVKPSYEKTKYKLQAAVFQARDIQKQVIGVLKARCEKMIDVRTRYTAFKIRRFKSGWALYGGALKRHCGIAGEVLREAKGILEGLRASGSVLGETVDAVEAGIAEQVSAAPEVQANAPPDVEEAAAAPDLEEAAVAPV